MTAAPFDGLPARDKAPNSASVLTKWVEKVANDEGLGPGRASWLVASAVVMGTLQRASHDDGASQFLIKGGTYLECRLGLRSRATKDLDALFRGTFHDFLHALDTALEEPWGPIEFERTEPKTIDAAGRLAKPVRFKIKLSLRGKPWRSVDVEVSPNEGHAGERAEELPLPPLDHFGLPSAPTAAGIALDYQVAQKLHAGTEPDEARRRVRDIVDLVVMRQAFYEGENLADLAVACRDLFSSRAREAAELGLKPRPWPPEIIVHQQWPVDFTKTGPAAGLDCSLDEAVAMVRDWIAEIDAA